MSSDVAPKICLFPKKNGSAVHSLTCARSTKPLENGKNAVPESAWRDLYIHICIYIYTCTDRVFTWIRHQSRVFTEIRHPSSTYKLRIWSWNTYFCWVWRVLWEPLFLILCYKSAYTRGFWARCSQPLLSKCLRILFDMFLIQCLGGWLRLIGQASVCSNLSISSPLALFLALNMFTWNRTQNCVFTTQKWLPKRTSCFYRNISGRFLIQINHVHKFFGFGTRVFAWFLIQVHTLYMRCGVQILVKIKLKSWPSWVNILAKFYFGVKFIVVLQREKVSAVPF